MSAKSQPSSISPARAALIESATLLAQKVLAEHNLSLVDLKLENSGQTRVLEITIHRPSGRVSLDDCEMISRKLDTQLESDAEIGLAGYLLQVQSPGIDRKLKTQREFSTFKGEAVEVKYKDSLDIFGYHFLGKLGNCTEEVVEIDSPKEFPAQDKKGKKSKSKKTEEVEIAYPKNLKLKSARISEIRLYPQLQINEQLNNNTTE